MKKEILGTIIKSRLLVDQSPSSLNKKLQECIDEFNQEGLIVRIESTYSASPNVTGELSQTATLYEYILVSGYEKLSEL